jgi:fructose-1-phosphate kinase PfkB-like protein
VISMGDRGALAHSSEGTYYAASPDITPVSTIGSGDSMVAGIAHALSRGESLEKALVWGTAAGAATAMTDGTEICSRKQVLELLTSVHVRQL